MAADMPKIKIDFVGGRGTLQVDGFALPNVCEASFAIRAGEPGSLMVTIVGDIEMSADAMELIARYLAPIEEKPTSNRSNED